MLGINGKWGCTHVHVLLSLGNWGHKWQYFKLCFVLAFDVYFYYPELIPSSCLDCHVQPLLKFHLLYRWTSAFSYQHHKRCWEKNSWEKVSESPEWGRWSASLPRRTNLIESWGTTTFQLASCPTSECLFIFFGKRLQLQIPAKIHPCGWGSQWHANGNCWREFLGNHLGGGEDSWHLFPSPFSFPLLPSWVWKWWQLELQQS